MKLTQPDKSALTLAFTEAIQNASLTFYHHVMLPEGWVDATRASLSDGFLTAFDKISDDSGLHGFVSHELQMTILAGGHNPPENGRRKISEYEPFADALAAAKTLVSKIERLPYQYTILTPFSKPLSDKIKSKNINISLSDQLRIVSGAKIDKSFVLADPIDHINSYFRASRLPSQGAAIVSDGLYFEFRASGLISDQYDPKLIREMNDEVRAFYGCCAAHDLIFSISFLVEEFTPFVIGNILTAGDTKQLAFASSADEDVSRMAALHRGTGFDEPLKSGESLSEIIAPAIKMFTSEESQRLKTAAIWLMRAFLSPRGMDKVLESTIAIEVMMGDRDTSDRVGLSKLMANRCAFALGKSSKERGELAEFFVKFYRVRSEIVHSGRFKLSEAEREVVSKGLNLASRILRHEIVMAA